MNQRSITLWVFFFVLPVISINVHVAMKAELAVEAVYGAAVDPSGCARALGSQGHSDVGTCYSI
jgi:hypothetical protein